MAKYKGVHSDAAIKGYVRDECISATPAAAAPAAAASRPDDGKERSVDPDDAKQYTHEQLLDKYSDIFSEDDIKAYWSSQRKLQLLLTGQAEPVPAPAPAPEAVPRAAAGDSGGDEQRRDPADGQVCMFSRFNANCKNKFSEAEIKAYWSNECTVVRAVAPNPVELAKTPAAAAEIARQADAPSAGSTQTAEAVSPPVASAATGPVTKMGGMRLMSIKEWLSSLDGSGRLLQYHDSMAGKYKNVQAIADAHWKNGAIDPLFFQVSGVKRIGHKRTFEKWLRDNAHDEPSDWPLESY
eukprot:gnl/TRDRNA2_/TRDRNA2_153081_c0_seq1.p1 gnl/TRDRNA2_/TRDRNA2_153081_c0~~gnl/TRDRNA2_/TRDRNA2_153081_c0_seq1.p1  ORF type:complete len:296 (-),score=69.56 gnl/TRDRNA2_/TRDRNA2_153081_c0_seq1:45-932(-)